MVIAYPVLSDELMLLNKSLIVFHALVFLSRSLYIESCWFGNIYRSKYERWIQGKHVYRFIAGSLTFRRRSVGHYVQVVGFVLNSSSSSHHHPHHLHMTVDVAEALSNDTNKNTNVVALNNLCKCIGSIKGC